MPVSGLNAHGDLPGSAAAGRELALALAGRPPGCEGLPSALLDQVVGMGISHAEDTGSAALWGLVTAAGQGR